MATGWVHDNILRRTASELHAQDPLLARVLREAEMDMTQYGDLREMESERMQLIFQAAERAYRTTLAQGPWVFYDPLGYAHFMHDFSELRALLKVDPRVRHVASTGCLTIRDGIDWQASGVYCDLILEDFAAATR